MRFQQSLSAGIPLSLWPRESVSTTKVTWPVAFYAKTTVICDGHSKQYLPVKKGGGAKNKIQFWRDSWTLVGLHCRTGDRGEWKRRVLAPPQERWTVWSKEVWAGITMWVVSSQTRCSPSLSFSLGKERWMSLHHSQDTLWRVDWL